jgi:DNA polymerase epsilon subunit 3
MAKKEKKSTITATYVMKALEEMEFEEFVEPLQHMIEVYNEKRAAKKPKKQAAKPGEEAASATTAAHGEDEDLEDGMNVDVEDEQIIDDVGANEPDDADGEMDDADD